jgi:hypothetical protein
MSCRRSEGESSLPASGANSLDQQRRKPSDISHASARTRGLQENPGYTHFRHKIALIFSSISCFLPKKPLPDIILRDTTNKCCSLKKMNSLTPDQFKSAVVAVVKQRCRCAVPGFQKIVSFNFEDYGIAPTLLWDSEILIQEVIRNGFEALNEGIQRHGDSKRRYQCRICGRVCTATYTEYSINMYRSFVLFEEDLRASEGEYVLGLRGFEEKDFDKITDFKRSENFDSYLASLTNPNSEQDVTPNA